MLYIATMIDVYPKVVGCTFFPSLRWFFFLRFRRILPVNVCGIVSVVCVWWTTTYVRCLESCVQLFTVKWAIDRRNRLTPFPTFIGGWKINMDFCCWEFESKYRNHARNWFIAQSNDDGTVRRSFSVEYIFESQRKRNVKGDFFASDAKKTEFAPLERYLIFNWMFAVRVQCTDRWWWQTQYAGRNWRNAFYLLLTERQQKYEERTSSNARK